MGRWIGVFFQQKTASEWRIIDWSSDVCSSDLLPGRASRPVCGRWGAVPVPIWSKTRVSTCFLTRNYSLAARDGSKDQPVRSQDDDDSACGGREASASSLLFDHCPDRRARAADAGRRRRQELKSVV